MRSAGCAVNDWADRDFDAHVKRTAAAPARHRRDRAVGGARGRARCSPSSRSCSCCRPTRRRSLLSLPALAIAIVYPFFKRFFVLPQAFLGIAFSFGIPMAFAAVLDAVPPLAWWLLLLNLFWVIAYDTEYAMVDRDDDLRLGLQTSAIAFGRFDVAAIMLCYAIYLAGMACVGRRARSWAVLLRGTGGRRSAARCGTGWLIRNRDRDGCFRRSCTTTGSASRYSPAIALDFAVRVGAWPRHLMDRGARATRHDAPARRRRRASASRAAAGAGTRHARADPRQLSGRGVARRAAVLRASAQPLLAAARRGARRAARRRCHIAQRLARCAAHGVGLWDTIVACERSGSLDGAIRNAEHGEIARVRRAAPRLALVCFNGKTAARREAAWREAGYATLVLPSSSPAYTRPFAEKLAAVAGDRRFPEIRALTEPVATAGADSSATPRSRARRTCDRMRRSTLRRRSMTAFPPPPREHSWLWHALAP